MCSMPQTLVLSVWLPVCHQWGVAWSRWLVLGECPKPADLADRLCALGAALAADMRWGEKAFALVAHCAFGHLLRVDEWEWDELTGRYGRR